jgi:hypothetical protein
MLIKNKNEGFEEKIEAVLDKHTISRRDLI